MKTINVDAQRETYNQERTSHYARQDARNVAYAMPETGKWTACNDCVPSYGWISQSGGVLLGRTKRPCAFCGHMPNA
jgi:hypothetical protein